jgi:hypothetical protein
VWQHERCKELKEVAKSFEPDRLRDPKAELIQTIVKSCFSSTQFTLFFYFFYLHLFTLASLSLQVSFSFTFMF